MTEFLTVEERSQWYAVVRAGLKGGRTGEYAVEIADYVLEQVRARSKRDKPAEQERGF